MASNVDYLAAETRRLVTVGTSLLSAIYSSPSPSSHPLPGAPGSTMPALRRIRIQHRGQWLADTLDAAYVWETKRYPYYYVPAAEMAALGTLKETRKGGKVEWEGGVVGRVRDVVVPGEQAVEVLALVFDDGVPGVGGFARVEFSRVDAWYEEETPIYVHPRDPTKRIFVIPSTRPLKVSLNGTVLATPTFYYRVLEPGLPPRYYLPRTSVDANLLKVSKTRSRCPYKGEAEYFDVVLPSGQQAKDVVWWYRHPDPEVRLVEGFLCFYNEFVDIDDGGVAVGKGSELKYGWSVR